MSDQEALLKAQLTNAHNELVQLKGMTRNISGQLAASKQAIDEYINANINIRASNLLLEDDVKTLRNQLGQTVERVNVLEKEKADLAAKLAEHEKELEPAA